MSLENRLREASVDRSKDSRLSDEAVQALSDGTAKAPTPREKTPRTPAAAHDQVNQGQVGTCKPNLEMSGRRDRPMTLEDAQRSLDRLTGHDMSRPLLEPPNGNHSQVTEPGGRKIKLSNESTAPKGRINQGEVGTSNPSERLSRPVLPAEGQRESSPVRGDGTSTPGSHAQSRTGAEPGKPLSNEWSDKKKGEIAP